MTLRSVAVVAVLVISGCGGDDEEPVASAEPTMTAQAAAPTVAAPTVVPPNATATATAPAPGATEVAPTVEPAATAQPKRDDGCPTGKPKSPPPADLAIAPGATVYASQGSNVFLAAIEGTAPGDTRDAAARALEEAGFSLRSSEDRQDAAVATLEGPASAVEIRVSPLCPGKLQVTYTVT